MRYLVFTNTPAHVHLYRRAVRRLQDDGHEVWILARDYQCTTSLLRYYDLPFTVYGRCAPSKLSLAYNLPKQYASILRLAPKFEPDLIFGMGSYAAHAGVITQTPTVLLLDSEHHDLDHQISHRFADALITPHAFRKTLGPNHYEFTGFKECAYLHPEVYTPSSLVRDDLGIGPEERYSVVRFNAFGSHHDVGEYGITPENRRKLVDKLAEYGPVVVSAEGGEFEDDDDNVQHFDLHPARFHDVLAEGGLVVTDTATVATEAALLGTPTLRMSSFVGNDDFGNFLELERQNLVENYDAFEAVFDRAIELVADPDTPETWMARRNEYMTRLANLTEIIVDTALRGGNAATVDGLRRYEQPIRPEPSELEI